MLLQNYTAIKDPTCGKAGPGAITRGGGTVNALNGFFVLDLNHGTSAELSMVPTGDKHLAKILACEHLQDDEALPQDS